MVKLDNQKKKLRKREVRLLELSMIRKFYPKIMILCTSKWKLLKLQKKNIRNLQENTRFSEMKKIILKRQNREIIE